jgi:hypothetical protein
MKGIYTPEFTPVANYGNNVLLDDGDTQEQYRVESVTSLPAIQNEPITVADGATERNVDLPNLETWDGWLAQYRLPRLAEELSDGVSIEIDQGGNQSPLFQNKNVRGSIDNDTVHATTENGDGSRVEVSSLSHLAELYVWEDETPKFTVSNTSGASVDVELTFTGFQFELSRGSSGSGQPVYIPVESIRGD